jgi:hypothetical protein
MEVLESRKVIYFRVYDNPLQSLESVCTLITSFRSTYQIAILIMLKPG